MVKVSVILLNWNQWRYTVACLDSLKKQSLRDFEVIIVDNGSEDDSVPKLKKYISRNRSLTIQLFQARKNLGFAAGNNQGIAKSQGEYIALVNNDSTVNRDYLKEQAGVLDRDESIAIVGAKVYNKYEKKEYLFEEYGTTTLTGMYAGMPGIDRHTRALVESFAISGGAMMFRRKAGLPFDPDYFIYHEDTYFSWKQRLLGFRNASTPGAVMKHEGSATVRDARHMSNRFIYLGERNRVMTLFICYGFGTFVRVAPMLAASVLLLNIYDVKHALTRMRSYGWLILNIQALIKKHVRMQRNRRVRDREIIKSMSFKLVDEKHISSPLHRYLVKGLNSFFRLYAKIAGLRALDIK